MTELHIIGAGLETTDEIAIELSDGRTLTFSLEKLLTLVPNAVVTDEGAEGDDLG